MRYWETTWAGCSAEEGAQVVLGVSGNLEGALRDPLAEVGVDMTPVASRTFASLA